MTYLEKGADWKYNHGLPFELEVVQKRAPIEDSFLSEISDMEEQAQSLVTGHVNRDGKKYM